MNPVLSPNDRARNVVLTALRAGLHGADPEPVLQRALADGGRDLNLEALPLDSLGWMEFCISVELATGLELTPAHIERMTRLAEIEDWLRARLVRG